MAVVPVKSEDVNAAEVAWFAPLCSDDYRHLGRSEERRVGKECA